MEINQEIAKKLLTWLQNGEDFVLTQAPDVAQQLITYHWYKSVIALFIALFLLGWFTFFVYRVFKANEIERYDKEFYIMIHVFGAVFSGIPGLIISFESISSLLMLTFAPKIWLLEYVTNLLK